MSKPKSLSPSPPTILHPMECIGNCSYFLRILILTNALNGGAGGYFGGWDKIVGSNASDPQQGFPGNAPGGGGGAGGCDSAGTSCALGGDGADGMVVVYW